MAYGIRTGDPRGFNKGRSSKFREGSRVRQTPEEGRRTYRPKRCGNNNKDEDNSPKNLNDKKSWWSFFKILCNDARERPSSWERLRWDYRISHPVHIVRTSWSQLPARTGIFYLLAKIVYWSWNLKFVYPTINLAFGGIIVKHPAKFCLHGFEWFRLQISSDTKYFSSFVQGIEIKYL